MDKSEFKEVSNMRIMTWNIQNCGTISFDNPNINNIQNILNAIKMVNSDIVIIQEYENEYHKNFVEEGLEKMSYSCTVCEDDADANLRKRVLVASKLPFVDCQRPIDIFKYSRRNWNEIFIPKYNLRVLGVDVPLAETKDVYGKKRDNRREKEQFLKALNKKFIEYNASNEPALILGDFNLLAEAVLKEYLDEFSSRMTEITTKDTTCGRHKFDYIFANNALLDLLDKNKTYAPNSTDFSDHKYLYIDINTM